MNTPARHPKPSRRFRIGLSLLSLLPMLGACSSDLPLPPPVDPEGSTISMGQTGDHYFDLDQIDRTNVSQLEVAWKFEMPEGGLQTTPLFRNGMLYAVMPTQQVVALNPETGKELWRYSGGERAEQPVRGLSYWRQGNERRLFSAVGHSLVALDPLTGKPMPDFGKGGVIDLREGLGRDPERVATFMTSPGVIFEDLIIVGYRTSESAPSAPGAIRAFDVRTGKQRWVFNVIPRPGEAGHESWPANAWKTAGGANSWAGMTVDAARGILFAPTGSAVDDFYGGDRLGNNLYANSLLALNARTGKRIWHFQTVHHDVWDRDLSSPPALLKVRRNGQVIDAVVQPSKQGFLFLFDRLTGRPLFPIRERPVPGSDLPGERTSPTQPFALVPTPIARQKLTADMLTKRTPQSHAEAYKAFREMRSGGQFLPLTVGKPTVIFPGFDGGAEWGGVGIDPRRGILFINSNDVPWTGELAHGTPPELEGIASVPGGLSYLRQCAVCHGFKREGSPPAFPSLVDVGNRLSPAQIAAVIKNGRGRMPGFPQLTEIDRADIVAFLTRKADAPAAPQREVMSPAPAPKDDRYFLTGYRKFVDSAGYPAAAPPWGTLNAIDLNSGRYLWKIPLGEYPELRAKGVPTTGSENYGGPIVTSTGLLFIGATIYDRKFRAFDTTTGKLLWESILPYSGVATPTTYVAGGRQFVVIAASGRRDPKGRQGAAYVAFALPDKRSSSRPK